jgi:FkbM family methyltransferase
LLPDPRGIARRIRARLRRLTEGPPISVSSSRPRVLGLDEIAELPRHVLEDACRVVASPVYVGNGVGLCRILTRYKFYVSTRDVGFGANVILDGYWESWLTQFMARTVRRGDVAVDIGANCGYYSLLLADLVGPDGRVYAVEPNPESASFLRRSIDLNGFAARTLVCEVAAGPVDGARATLFAPDGEPKNAALLTAAPDGRAGDTHEVAVRSLDRLLRDERRIGFIKIDAEGGEEGIIDGMAEILRDAPPPMVLEFNAARYPDPASFLHRLTTIYGRVRYVDYDGRAAPVAASTVLKRNFGEDWLLYLARR